MFGQFRGKRVVAGTRVRMRCALSELCLTIDSIMQMIAIDHQLSVTSTISNTWKILARFLSTISSSMLRIFSQLMLS